jgi:hypothetical protein
MIDITPAKIMHKQEVTTHSRAVAAHPDNYFPGFVPYYTLSRGTYISAVLLDVKVMVARKQKNVLIPKMPTLI